MNSTLIVGAGTWGCSIALELARRSHKSIAVLDGSTFPSAISAGNDLNKIAEEGMSHRLHILCDIRIVMLSIARTVVGDKHGAPRPKSLGRCEATGEPSNP